jgi:hypothetical protein
MKIKDEMLDYETPKIEVIEVEVEKGFQASGGTYPRLDPTEIPL